MCRWTRPDSVPDRSWIGQCWFALRVSDGGVNSPRRSRRAGWRSMAHHGISNFAVHEMQVCRSDLVEDCRVWPDGGPQCKSRPAVGCCGLAPRLRGGSTPPLAQTLIPPSARSEPVRTLTGLRGLVIRFRKKKRREAFQSNNVTDGKEKRPIMWLF